MGNCPGCLARRKQKEHLEKLRSIEKQEFEHEIGDYIVYVGNLNSAQKFVGPESRKGYRFNNGSLARKRIGHGVGEVHPADVPGFLQRMVNNAYTFKVDTIAVSASAPAVLSETVVETPKARVIVPGDIDLPTQEDVLEALRELQDVKEEELLESSEFDPETPSLDKEVEEEKEIDIVTQLEQSSVPEFKKYWNTLTEDAKLVVVEDYIAAEKDNKNRSSLIKFLEE